MYLSDTEINSFKYSKGSYNFKVGTNSIQVKGTNANSLVHVKNSISTDVTTDNPLGLETTYNVYMGGKKYIDLAQLMSEDISYDDYGNIVGSVEGTVEDDLIVASSYYYDYYYDDIYNLDLDNGVYYDEPNLSTGTTIINLGKGNDYFIASFSEESRGDLYQYEYANGDGNDVIDTYLNFNSDRYTTPYKNIYFNTGTNFKINVDGTINKVSYKSNDLIFNVGSGSIKVKNAKNFPIRYSTTNNPDKEYVYLFGKEFTYQNYFNQYGFTTNGITDYKIAPRIENKVIEGTDENNYINLCELDRYSEDAEGNVTVTAGKGDDFITTDSYNNVFEYSLGDGNDTIKFPYVSDYYENGDYDYNPYISYNGFRYDAMDIYYEKYDKSKEYINDYKPFQTIHINGSSYTKSVKGKDLILKVGSGSIRIIDGKVLQDYIKIYSTDSEGNEIVNIGKKNFICKDVICKSSDYSDKSYSEHYLSNTLVGGTDGNDYIRLYNILDDDLTIVNVTDNTIEAGKGDDYIELFKTYGDTLGEESIGWVNNVFKYTNGDGNDTIALPFIGYSNQTEQTIKIIGNSYKKSLKGKDVIIKVGSGSITIKNGKWHNIEIMTADSEGHEIPQGVAYNVDYTNVTLDNKFNKYYEAEYDYGCPVEVFKASQYHSAIQNISAEKRTKAVIIEGNYSDNSIVGGSKIDTIFGGEGNDTLTGGKGNDSLKGGSGADTFVYTNCDGNDVIADYNADEDDIIKLGKKTAISGTAINEDYMILTVGKGKISVEGGANQNITVLDNNNLQMSYSTISSNVVDDLTEVVLTDKESKNYSLTEGSADIIDASKRKKAIKIIADGNDNTIIGGKGNDNLTGGGGTDTFVYTNGYGNDRITDYSSADGDIIKLGDKTAISGVTIKNKDMIFTVGKAKITVTGGASQVVTVVDSNNIKTTYEKYIPSSGYEERWFIDDSEVETQSAEIDSILQNADNNINIESNVLNEQAGGNESEKLFLHATESLRKTNYL